MLFLAIGFICLVIMLFTNKFYVFGGLSIISFFIYFILVGTGTWVTFLLFLAGIFLLILEIFIPDFGLIGITGGVLVGLGYLSNQNDLWGSLLDLGLAIVIAVVTAYILLKKGYTFLPGKSSLILGTALEKNRGYSTAKDYSLFLGKTGTASTTLRPSGKADIDGQTLDVVSDGAIIREGSRVQVIHVEGIKIIVKELV
ncbi:NfeD family protein [Jeotgalibaca arthritidis]|uniref:Hydrolase n=1 Tax=Jeotgalibaca arthritidis TaxID=1868794 RepID=A0A6G7KBX7_9LACT|nr:NfeD family protein [Jeotgalibaca arthritidis]QII82747.1 hydrolase [Jeotgalibaca arthritidis]